jgi:hypothetical protein
VSKEDITFLLDVKRHWITIYPWVREDSKDEDKEREDVEREVRNGENPSRPVGGLPPPSFLRTILDSDVDLKACFNASESNRPLERKPEWYPEDYDASEPESQARTKISVEEIFLRRKDGTLLLCGYAASFHVGGLYLAEGRSEETARDAMASLFEKINYLADLARQKEAREMI